MTNLQTNCIQGSLQPYVPSASNPWTKERVAHLHSRAGFGASVQDIEAGLQMTPSDLVDQLIDNSLAIPPHYVPSWALSLTQDSANYVEIIVSWVDKMVSQPFKAKMTLFWHNHFVTERRVYGYFSFMFQYYKTLYDNSLGNFRTFTEQVGTTAAMLRYLNGHQNIAADPNENYARELYELFTLGEGNGYTEDDIIDTARALTGWRADYTGTQYSYFHEPYHDSDPKTIFGQTGNFGYQEVHDLIFTQRASTCAFFICSKLYKYFVYDEIDVTIVAEMATIFEQNWDIAEVMRVLLKSEHFFDAEAIGVRIKDHIESFASILKLFDITKYDGVGTQLRHLSTEYILFARAYDIDQRLFDPVNVAGWKNHRNWINSTNYTFRKDNLEYILRVLVYPGGEDKMLQDVIQLTNASADGLFVTQAIVEHVLRTPISADRLAEAYIVFQDTVPSNYFEDGTWSLYYPGVENQIIALLKHLTSQPEFELS